MTHLRALIGERATDAVAVREAHGRSEAYHAPHPPDLVAFPETTAEVAAIVSACAAARVPVVPFGAGTSLEGNALSVHGGVCVDFARMNRVLDIHADDMDCRVQPGITRKQLNAELRNTGLFFPIDPGADASIGGMASTRASGTMAVRYGTMRDNVLALEVVLASGAVIRTGRRARKSSAGYDLTRLFVGAEGTLGIITDITLRLHPVPEAISAAVCPFGSFGGAVDTAIAVIQSGIPAARIELLDDVMIRGVNAYAKLGVMEHHTLFFEFHGTPAAVAEQAARTEEIARDNGALAFQSATKAEDRSRLWNARDNTLYAGLGLRPGAQGGDHGRLRADLAARRMPHRDQAGYRRDRPDRADRRACRRRQFPHADPDRSDRAGRARARQGAARAHGRACSATRWHMHRRARDRPRQDGFPAGRIGQCGIGHDGGQAVA